MISRTIEPTFWLYSSFHSPALDFEPRPLRERPGVVDEDIDAAESLVHRPGHGIGTFIRAQVSDRDDRLAPGGGDLRRDPLRRASRRPCTTTDAPSAASNLAIASPIPLLLPVTTARFPLS